LTAYRLTKDHAFSRLAEQRKQSGQSAFRLFELGYLRNRLLDHGMLKKELIALADRYAQHYGDRFRL
jgi:hypothetical protein